MISLLSGIEICSISCSLDLLKENIFFIKDFVIRNFLFKQRLILEGQQLIYRHHGQR